MRVLLAGDQPQDRDQGRRAALRAGLECAAADCVPLADLRSRLTREPLAHLVVVYCEPDPAAAAGAIRVATSQTRQPIYAVTAGDDAVRAAATDAGARQVWLPDGVKEGLVISADELRRTGQVAENRGRFVAIASAQAGTGVTTVATGLAFGLAKSGPIVLAELGTGVPELALDLDLQPKHSLAELIRASERVDVSMIREAAVQHAAGVSVLAFTPESLTPELLTPAVARDFEILLRSGFAWSVVDAGHGIAPGTEELFNRSDAVVVVTRLDPPSLRLTRRYLVTLAERGVPVDEVMVVANRHDQSGLVPWKKAEEALRTKVVAWLPDDPSSVNRALRDGKPLVEAASRSRLTREFSRLASELQTRLAPKNS